LRCRQEAVSALPARPFEAHSRMHVIGRSKPGCL
jgi:hypothetical protein